MPYALNLFPSYLGPQTILDFQRVAAIAVAVIYRASHFGVPLF